jgi:3-oxoacyl-[acyl-carrier-protein] synthase-1
VPNCKIEAIGLINALGRSCAEIFPRLLAGDRSGVQLAPEFLADGEARLGLVAGPLPLVPDNLSTLRSRNTQLLVASFEQIAPAVSAAIERFGAHRIGVVVGSSTSGIPEGERAITALEGGGSLPEGYDYSQQEMGAVSDIVRTLAGARGPAYCISTACSSSAKVFRAGKELLAAGICDAVIVGGADCLCRMTVRGFGSLELLSAAPTIPLSKNRSGINIGEGAALLLLTREAGGVQLCGVGEASDAYHISSPHPEGKGACSAMRAALTNAGITPSQISYLNLHGTGTLHNDAMEARAVAEVFGEHLSVLACSSTKPLVGHMLGASGATEVAFCAMVLEAALLSGSCALPPHVYDEEYDEKLPPLSLVKGGDKLSLRDDCFVMSNSFGFGGSNCAVVLGVSADRESARRS